jgi:RIO-like serine/threonine protein kinase
MSEYTPLSNPHGFTRTFLSHDRTHVLKTYDEMDSGEFDRMIRIWRVAVRLKLAPKLLEHHQSSKMVKYAYVTGVDMYTYASNHTRKEVRYVIGMTRQAMNTLHSHGIIFGDLNPGNVIVTICGRIMLIDWDTCRSIQEDVDALRLFPLMIKNCKLKN